MTEREDSKNQLLYDTVNFSACISNYKYVLADEK